ncbi:MAG: TIGR04255 family protein, partial [Nitrospirota bacterium]|nr:TIGR04255 family protein [Nitrospirota bacterium]
MPNYKKPPVREAIIDIRVDRLPPTVLPELDHLHERLKTNYPSKKAAYAFEARLEMQEASTASSQKSHGIIGYHFVSSDEKKIIQLKLDGFAFNRLKLDPNESWSGWETLREEAKTAWELYVDIAKPKEITRLAVRYINQVVIRAVSIELDDYFTAPPHAPKDFRYQDLENFFGRVAISIPDLNATAVITHAPAPNPFPDSVTIILDIDIFRQQRMALDSLMIWETLDRFRELKNNVFEA